MIRCKVGFIGGGNMAQAIVTGMLDSGVIKLNLLMVSAPSNRTFPFWEEKGISTTHSNAEVVEKCDVIILGMKPQYLDEAIRSFDPVANNKLYISILAGISIEILNEKLRTHFKYSEAGPEPWRIVRVIPNTPIMVGAGATAYAVSERVEDEDSQLVKTIFSAGGLCEAVPERLLNAVGALSGSGPAYVYLMIEALCDGGVKMGVPRALATKLACQTLLGAAKMVQTTGKHPGQLKDEVCSPGGTTITGVHVLEKSGVRAALIGAVEAATNRSFELGNKNTDRPLSRRSFMAQQLIDELVTNEPVRAENPIEGQHEMQHLPGRKERLCPVCRKRSVLYCSGCGCGVHALCFSKLDHTKPLRRGRKRRLEAVVDDSDSDISV